MAKDKNVFHIIHRRKLELTFTEKSAWIMLEENGRKEVENDFPSKKKNRRIRCIEYLNWNKEEKSPE